MRIPTPLLIVFLALVAPLAAQEPVGPEVSVNQTRAGRQWSPDVGVAADGSFVVVWADEQAGRVWVRLYRASGKPRGGEFRVSRLGDRQQAAPAVAVRPDGSFVVAWNRINPRGKVEVYASRFSASGQPLGQPRLVGYAGQASAEEPAAVVTLPDGGFFVAWSLEDGGTYWHDGDTPSRDVYARRFTRDGVLVGGRVTLNPDSFGDQSLPNCALARQVEIVCVYATGQGEGSFGDVSLRRFDLNGLPLSAELQVNGAETEGAMQGGGDLAVHPNGTILVVWVDSAADIGEHPGLEDAFGVLGRRLDASGGFASAPFHLTGRTVGEQYSPHAVATDAGFALVWGSRPGNGEAEALLRRMTTSGTFTSAERVLDQRHDAVPAQLAVAFGPRGGAVAWGSFTQGFNDGDISVRRLR